MRVHHIFFIHSSVDRRLHCFHVLTIVNSIAMNIGVHVSFWNRVFIFSGYLPRSGIAGSYLLLILTRALIILPTPACLFFFFRKLTACPACLVNNECQVCHQQGNFCTSWWKDAGSCPSQEEDKEKDSFLGNWRSRRIFNLHLPVR